MRKSNLKRFYSFLFLFIALAFWQFLGEAPKPAYALNQFQEESQNSKYVCAVYFTGIGCPHCAKTDPFLFEKVLSENKNVVVIEYEVYHSSENAAVFEKYIDLANLPDFKKGIPALYFDANQDQVIVGDRAIIQELNESGVFEGSNQCLLINGEKKSFKDVDVRNLPGKPKIWKGKRVLVKEDNSHWIFAWKGEKIKTRKDEFENSSDILSQLIASDNFLEVLKNAHYKSIDNYRVQLSGKSLYFDNAVVLTVTPSFSSRSETASPLTIGKIVSLAVVDSVNPCALAVLTLMLLAILTYNPQKRRNVLLAGIAFIASVFLMYLFYGLVIIKFFQIIQALTAIRLYLYKALGLIAIILGILNIKDFIKYKPGGFLTEMPLFLRPKVKKIISGITSPKGAFITGLFVTLFLLPCTIGPYIIAGGILSAIKILKTIPWLILYNLIFVLPMVCIVLLVYLGVSKVEDVSQWKEKNIRYLHLVAGLIMVGLGVGMLFGLI